jgi:uncharacterized protein
LAATLGIFLLATVLLLATAGHFGFWIACYNRINATGLKRTTIKATEKLFALAAILIPFLLIGFEWARHQLQWSSLETFFSSASWVTTLYITLACCIGILATPFWIANRPQWQWARGRVATIHSEVMNYPERIEKDRLFQNRKFRWMASLPRNQIVAMDRNEKELYLQDLPSALVGLKIAHLSDIHFTGKMTDTFYRYAIDWVSQQQPDLVVIAGDIVDYEHALPQIDESLSCVKGKIGQYFVLGNHDRRLKQPTWVCDRLERLGWTDLGKSNALVVHEGVRLRLVGNERPWFNRHQKSDPYNTNTYDWTLGVSHSPDQFHWGVQEKCGLLLCGHTHGGQIRFPLIGPVIAPSWHGSRFASGVFEREGTVMHVSRGISGVHPYRWGCLPEVTILHLAQSPQT